jgi:hypothetical protein
MCEVLLGRTMVATKGRLRWTPPSSHLIHTAAEPRCRFGTVAIRAMLFEARQAMLAPNHNGSLSGPTVPEDGQR